MISAAYYNEHESYAAQWLRNLITAGHIAPGDVDERSIEDVHPDDLRPYTQCHFFAGIGVWSLALRRAGWPDDRPVWTGSCPCQPFSQAGEGAGFDDQRHLWPAFHWLIQERRPAVVFGEQVASNAVEPWVNLVHADLEALGYAFGAVPFPAAGVGAPNIRDRLYWVADANGSTGRQGRSELRGRSAGSAAQPRTGLGGVGVLDGMDNTHHSGSQGHGQLETASRRGDNGLRPARGSAGTASSTIGLADTDRQRCGEARGSSVPGGQTERAERTSIDSRPCQVNGFWRDADWLLCRDGKWRPVEPGAFPLVARPSAELGRVQPGLARLYGRNRAGRLRGYGNAINAEAATQFIAAYLDATA